MKLQQLTQHYNNQKVSTLNKKKKSSFRDSASNENKTLRVSHNTDSVSRLLSGINSGMLLS